MALEPFCIDTVKGWTRISCVAFIALAVSELDVNDLRDMVLEEEKNSTLLPLAKVGKPSKSEEQQPKKDSSSWKDILDLQIPATQSASE